MKQAHISLNRRDGTWHLRYYAEDGRRKSQLLGTTRDWKDHEECRKANRRKLNLYNRPVMHVPSVAELVRQYREEKMSTRFSTRRSNNVWLSYWT
jgi:hypothetical protein